MNLRTLTRKGQIVFAPGQQTENQCKDVGHRTYNYTVTILFHPDQPLNEQGWFIDNKEVDDCVQAATVGSCEEMCRRITSRLQSLLAERGIATIGFKFTLFQMYPVPITGVFFTHAWIDPVVLTSQSPLAIVAPALVLGLEHE